MLRNRITLAGLCCALILAPGRATPQTLAPVAAPPPACIDTRLYSSDFESGSGLVGWETGFLFGNQSAVNDWRGAQACTANSGSQIFRFGGETCGGLYGSNQVAYAAAPAFAIPPGSRDTRLSVWHRWDFEDGQDGGRLSLRLDANPMFFLAEDAHILSGATHNGTLAGDCGAMVHYPGLPVFTGESASFQTTVVDLDAVCDFATGSSGGCAGHTIRPGFIAFTDCGVEKTGWFLDDVELRACVPPPPSDFYTLSPCRLLDTRSTDPPALQPGAERLFAPAGRCGVPATATALAVNLTVVQTGSGGHLQIWPGDQAVPPNTSVINFLAGQTRANSAVLALPPGGAGTIKILAATASPLHFVLDVFGYFE